MYDKAHPYNLKALEVAKSIRRSLSGAGIKGHVKKYYSCGHLWVRISTRAYEQRFTQDEQLSINEIAKNHDLRGPGNGSDPIELGRFFGQELHSIVPA